MRYSRRNSVDTTTAHEQGSRKYLKAIAAATVFAVLISTVYVLRISQREFRELRHEVDALGYDREGRAGRNETNLTATNVHTSSVTNNACCMAGDQLDRLHQNYWSDYHRTDHEFDPAGMEQYTSEELRNIRQLLGPSGRDRSSEMLAAFRKPLPKHYSRGDPCASGYAETARPSDDAWPQRYRAARLRDRILVVSIWESLRAKSLESVVADFVTLQNGFRFVECMSHDLRLHALRTRLHETLPTLCGILSSRSLNESHLQAMADALPSFDIREWLREAVVGRGAAFLAIADANGLIPMGVSSNLGSFQGLFADPRIWSLVALETRTWVQLADEARAPSHRLLARYRQLAEATNTAVEAEVQSLTPGLPEQSMGTYLRFTGHEARMQSVALSIIAAEAIALERVAHAAIAIESFRLRKGHYPGSLSDVVPLRPSVSQFDPFGGEQLRYVTFPNGYRVYSIGLPMASWVESAAVDDGGLSRRERQARLESVIVAVTRTLPFLPTPTRTEWLQESLYDAKKGLDIGCVVDSSEFAADTDVIEP